MAKKQGPGRKGSRKIGRNTRKPAFQRYKAENRCEKRKVRNLMRSNGMTQAEAIMFRHKQQTQTTTP